MGILHCHLLLVKVNSAVKYIDRENLIYQLKVSFFHLSLSFLTLKLSLKSLKKDHLLNLLRNTLPDQIFQMIIAKLPEVSEKIFKTAKQKVSTTIHTTSISEAQIAVDDLHD